ncbi:hypothetical protein [uncultured Clostridium sp.]|uniref:hypothetical protein n=1 Tax=uncultured Clostridium sp. TaxID=59620 RepID=UPI0028E86204|nr:hypothetical protein [uncultured Clostridium sp.]
MDDKKYLLLEKVIRLLTKVFFILSIIIFLYFIKKRMDAYELIPEEQYYWNYKIEPLLPYIQEKINEAKNLGWCAFTGLILTLSLYIISSHLKEVNQKNTGRLK